jgi:hypothetical protein
MRFILPLIIAIILSGCNQDNERTTSDEDMETFEPVRFAITYYNEYDKSFTAQVVKNKYANLDDIVKLPTEPLAEKQLCLVEYSKNDGHPEVFSCSEPPIPLDSFIAKGATLEKEWYCDGLDGFGGRYHTKHDKESLLKINSDGTYAITHSAKKGSDYIWHIAATTVSGKWYSTSYNNQLKLNPVSITSKVIDAANAKMEDASYFLVLKETFEIDLLTDTEMSGITRFNSGLNANSRDESIPFSCHSTSQLTIKSKNKLNEKE